MTELLLLIIAAGIGVLIFRKPGSQVEPTLRMERVRQPEIAPPVAHAVPQIVPPTVTPAVSPPSKAGAVMLMLMALLYTISPIDFIPDIFPVLGWLDDIGVLSYAGKNLSKAMKGPVSPV